MKILVFLLTIILCSVYAFAADNSYKLKQGAVIEVVNVSADTLYNSPAVTPDGLKGVYKTNLFTTPQSPFGHPVRGAFVLPNPQEGGEPM
jgi:hypothetical protein